MSEPKRVGRRTFLNYAIAVVATGVIVGAATYFAVPKGEVTITAPGTTVTTTKTVTTTVTGTPTTTPPTTLDYYYDPSLKGTTITFLAANVPETPYTQQMATLFESETGIKVNFIVEPEDVVASKASIAFASKSPDYDIVHGSGFGSFAFAWFYSGYVEDLEPYIRKTPSTWNKNDILPAILNNVSTTKDEIYCLPYGTVDYPYFYRTDLIDKPAKTIDEMISNAKKVFKPPTMYGWTSGGTPDVFSFFTWDMFLWACGGRWFDPETFHPELNTPESYESLRLLIEASKYAPSFTTTDAAGAAMFVAQGTVAQATDFSTWYPSTMIGPDSKVIGKMGYAPHPGVVSEPHMLACITNSISKFSKKKDAAWSFLSFLSSPRICQMIFEAGYSGTIRKSTLDNPKSKQVNPYAVEVLSWLADAKPAGSKAPKVASPILPIMPRAPDFVSIVVKNMAEALAGKIGYKEALDKAQEQATALMKEIGIYK